jgi:hypothetical protein
MQRSDGTVRAIVAANEYVKRGHGIASPPLHFVSLSYAPLFIDRPILFLFFLITNSLFAAWKESDGKPETDVFPPLLTACFKGDKRQYIRVALILF